ncbi:type I restriction enzyme specificity protein [Burkholderia pseudomallei]|nr:type I restriction enzyme specificity protein [Burkholderia pseudomallei]VBQ49559.1 type I restriction enzyme specificity protein [Burkholderia pseudomallei]
MATAGAYPSYRESELPWVPKLPHGWQVLRNGRLFAHRVETGFPDLPILEVSLRTGVRVRDMENLKRKQVMSQKEKYKRAVKGDIAYNMMRMWQGAVGPAPVDGLVSPAYVVVKPFPEVNSTYYSYLFRTDAYMREVNKFSRGIVADRNRLYWDEFKQMPSLVPPRTEQDQIVAYLRVQDAHIARFIKAKRDMIALLKEQLKNIIARAVTQGIRPNVSKRSSGIEWLPEIPVHWQTGSVRSEMECLNRRRVPLSAIERGHLQGEYDYYGASGVIDHICKYIFDEDALLIAEDGANLVLRNLPLAIVARGKFWVNNHAHILKPRQGSLEYFAHLMECVDYRPWISGAAQPKLTKDRLLSIRIPVPPRAEQAEIVKYISAEIADPSTAIERATHEISLIREYRDRLIADVVTGQRDVRSWVPGPDDVVTDGDLAALGDDEQIDAEGEGDDGDD